MAQNHHHRMEKVRLFTSLDLEKKRAVLDQPYAIDAPWIVFLLANTHEPPVRIHTIVGITNLDIESIEYTFNSPELNPYKQTHRYAGHWVVIVAAAGFEYYDAAKDFFLLWHDDARGIASRTARGVAMYDMYRKDHPGLRLYSVNLSREDKEAEIRRWIEHRQQAQREQELVTFKAYRALASAAVAAARGGNNP